MVDNFQKTILDRGLRIQDDNLLLKQIESMDKNSKGSDISNIINQIQAELPSEDKKLYIKTLQEKITEFALGNETVDSNTTVADYLVKHLGTLPIPKPLAMSRITALQNALEGTKDKDTEPVQPQQPPALKKAPPVAPKPTIASMLENPKTLGTTVIALINNPNYKLTGDDFNAINAKISAAHINIHENNSSLNTIAEPLNIAMNAYVKYMHSNPSPIDKNVMDNAKQIYDLAVEVKPILKDTLDTKQFCNYPGVYIT